MKTKKQIIKRILIGIGIFFLLLIILFISFRNSILRASIAKVTSKMERDYDAKLSIKTAEFDGLTGVKISKITLVPRQADTLLAIEKLQTSVRLLPLFVGDIQLGTLYLENGLVQLTKKGNRKNFSAFLKKESASTTASDGVTKRNYADLAYRLISKGLNLVPTDMEIKNLTFKLDDNGKKSNHKFTKIKTCR